jgi:hypothetical protein
MKQLTTLSRLIAFSILSTFVLQGCLKDTVSRTYTMYLPVYKTTAEVRADIRSAAPVAVKNPGKMFLFGNYIFLNEINKGIHIIDNTNPAAPVNKHFINIPGNVDLAVTGTTLYADLYTDMITLDISDPTSVKVKKIIEGAFPFRRYSGNFSQDQAKIITDWVQVDTTITTDYDLKKRSDVILFQTGSLMDLQSSSNMTMAAKATLGISGSMARFTLLNNYLYTVTENALNVFNISVPENPVFSNKIQLGWGIETIYPFKNNLFIGSQTGMLVYSANNPQQPSKLGSFAHARVCDPVIADDNYAFVTLRSGSTCAGFTNQLDIVNIQNLPTTTLVKSYPLTNPHGLSKDGNTLIICDGKGGLKIYDASNVNALQLLQTITGMETYDVIAYNNLAIVVAKDGLYEYDYSNRSNVKLLSSISYSK